MKFKINKLELLQLLTIVGPVVSTNSSLIVLTGVLIKAENDKIIVQANDSQEAIECSASALIEQQGEVLVSFKLFDDIIKRLQDGIVSLELKTNPDGMQNLVINAGAASFMIKTLKSDDFPRFPQLKEINTIQLPFNEFSQAVKLAGFAASEDQSSLSICGVFLKSIGNILEIVSTDSFRLARAQVNLSTAPVEDFSVKASKKYFKNIISAPKTTDLITISTNSNQIITKYQNITYVARRIEGEYINYTTFLPSEFDNELTINTKNFQQSIDRVLPLCGKDTPIKIKASCDLDTCEISATSKDNESALELVQSKLTGNDMEIKLNNYFFNDGLRRFPDTDITIKYTSKIRSIVFEAENLSYYYFLPVALN